MHHLGVSGQRGGTDPGRLLAHPVEDITGGVHDTATRCVGNSLQHNEIAEAFQQIDSESAGVVPGVDDRFDCAEQCRGIASGKRIDGVVDQGDIGDSQECQRSRVVHPVAVSAGQQLVEHAESVAGGTAAGSNDQREYRIVDLDGFSGKDVFEEAAHGARCQ